MEYGNVKAAKLLSQEEPISSLQALQQQLKSPWTDWKNSKKNWTMPQNNNNPKKTKRNKKSKKRPSLNEINDVLA